MHTKKKLALLLLTVCVIIPGEALLFPILFPLSIKITIHSNKPTPAPSYHFEPVPVYREVVVKGSAHITPIKQSYGDGQKYGTSYGDGQKYGTNYGDGHVKVYTEGPHIRGPKYASGYGSGTGGGIDGHFSISSYPVTSQHDYKGNSYDVSAGDYDGEPYPQNDYKVTSNQGAGHYKGTAYDDQVPATHYKGVAYDDKAPPTHYKGTAYGQKIPPSTHYKGTTYEEVVPTHYKGNPYDAADGSYKGGTGGKTKLVYNPHEYIKPVGGGYKVSDYINNGKPTQYPEDDDYIAIPPGKSYSDYEAAHKASSHGPKAYSAEQYSDLGATKYNKKEYEHDASYLDDTLPEYKASIPRPPPKSRARRPPQYHHQYEASASRYDRVLPEPQQASSSSTTYAGFGTSIYGDSYAKVAYVPKTLRISIKAYAHK